MVMTDLTARLADAAQASSLEALTRPLLELLEEITGLESTYLTRVDESAGIQEILYSRNVGDIEIPEGLQVEWADTLCKRALESGTPCADDVPAIWGDSEAARAMGLQTYVSTPIRTPNGALFGTLCGASGSKHTLDQEQQRVLGLFARVIADQVAREQARQEEFERAALAERRLKARARMLAIAEHELKSPLTVLLGWTRIIAESSDPATLVSAAPAMERAAVRLQTQIDRMLEEARAEVIARELDLHELDLGPEVEHTVEQLAEATATHKLEFSARSVITHADRTALYQIAVHLIENALKYSPPGSTVRVRVQPDGADAVLRVIDAGPGIPEDVDIFEPFSRGSENSDGVGLGLHIVKTLAEAMGGTVSAHRNTGPGSTFEVRLPAR